MRIFLSYASDHRAIADDLCCRLQAVGHDVFFDREDLPAGRSFDDYIRGAIEDSDLFVFLIAPESVAEGRYTRTELKIANRKWPTPGWHVLPVELAPTPIDQVPAYLRSVTVLQPEGNLAAEVVMEVEDRARGMRTERAPSQQDATRSGSGRYRSFQLSFGAGEAGGYRIAVPESPVGRVESDPVELDTPRLEKALWSNAQRIDGSARRATTEGEAHALLPRPADAREVGKALYTALFESPLGARLEESLRTVDPQRGEGLRFVIDTTGAPELARLPWEFLYSPAKDDFLFSDRMKPVVRWLDVDEPLPSLAAEPPLRLLIAIASPTDRPGLDVGEEIAHLDTALAELTGSGAVDIVRLDHATLESLDNAMLKARPHVLHFIGHGDFSGDEGVLVLESDVTPGATDIIAGRRLAMLLRNHLTSLRLVFLNSCAGAMASRSDPFGGVAQSLIRRGIPAVIAMQFPVPDKAAVALSRHFYRYLAAGQPVDAALNSARAFLIARGYEVEWGAPALHMRTPDGRLFDMMPAAVEAEEVETTVREPSAARQPVEAPAQAPPPAPAPTAPPEPERTKSAGRRGLWLLAGAAIMAVVIVLVVPFFGGARGPVPDKVIVEPGTDVQPGDGQSQGRVPGDGGDPRVEPDIPPRPVDPDSRPVVDETQEMVADVLARFERDDDAGAVTALRDLLAADPEILSQGSLDFPRDEIIDALARVIDNSSAAGDLTTTSLASDLLEKLEVGKIVDCYLPGEVRKLGGSTYLAPRRLVRIPENQCLIRGGEFFIVAPGEDTSSEAFAEYMVSRGDTMWAISGRLTGDPTRWPQLVETNNSGYRSGRGGSLIHDPDLIFPGQKILVPTTGAAGGGAIEYHVARGDSLWRIAERIYGDPLMWLQVFADNSDSIANPDLIYPGQVLILRQAAGR